MIKSIGTKASRRHFMVLGAACLVGRAGSVLASESGGGSGGSDGRDGVRHPQRSGPDIKNNYSQREFTRLREDEIFEFSKQPDAVIDGFSHNMTTFILFMAKWNRRRTQGLVRDMSKLKSRKARLNRLNEEKQYAERSLEKLREALERAEKLKLQRAISETKYRIKDAEDYLKGLNVWIEYPQEGTR